MSLRVAFVGFRHGHVGAIYADAQRLDFVEIVGAVEEDLAARDSIPAQIGATLTHETLDEMIAGADFEALVIGDVYARRGAEVIAGLRAGKHVFADKPLCTRLSELREIAGLARRKDLKVGVDLSLRYTEPFVTMREIILGGGIGEVASVIITGTHPLAYGVRPMWYFEPGQHGGTLNDILIHGVDMLRWATGREVAQVVAAEADNCRLPGHPHFQDRAEALLRLDNGARVYGETSYLCPEGHHAPWRFTFWGTEGYLQVDNLGDFIWQRKGEPQQNITPQGRPPVPSGFEDFARQIEFGAPAWLSTADALRSTATTLTIQQAADERERDVEVEAP